VLFALDDPTYCEEIVSAFERCRPHFRVRSVERREMTSEALRFRPHLVVFDAFDRRPLVTLQEEWDWVQLFRRVPTLAIIKIGGRYQRMDNVRVEDLLAIADEVEELSFGEEH
jgi:hypothetical protein